MKLTEPTRSDMSKVHEVYAHLMKRHSRGYALYHPVYTGEIAVGMLGYFDENGFWKMLIQDVTTTSYLTSSSSMIVIEPYGGTMETREDSPAKVSRLLSVNLEEKTFKGGLNIEYQFRNFGSC